MTDIPNDFKNVCISTKMLLRAILCVNYSKNFWGLRPRHQTHAAFTWGTQWQGRRRGMLGAYVERSLILQALRLGKYVLEGKSEVKFFLKYSRDMQKIFFKAHVQCSIYCTRYT